MLRVLVVTVCALTAPAATAAECNLQEFYNRLFTLRDPSQLVEKDRVIRQAIACEQSSDHPSPYPLGGFFEELGDDSAHLGNADDAKKNFDQAVALYTTAAYGGPPLRDLIRVLRKEADLRLAVPDTDGAKQLLLRAADIAFQQAGDSSEAIEVAGKLAPILADESQLDDAIDLWRRALQMIEADSSESGKLSTMIAI
jgi:tetratricopeptide (TPR) repeat protein